MPESFALPGATPPDTSIQDVSRAWGQRGPQRWTYGTPGRTRFIEAINRLKTDLENLQGDINQRCQDEAWEGGLQEAPQVMIPDLDKFIDSLCESWSGELGRDTNDFIRGISAARSTTNIHQAAPQELP
ncbi:MAG TPA: hypothetical protein VM286_06255 [Candidatus Thermoplasmatota archaeon]|nr:hypothetical protein [Candidatus Thermoplasmatota archaeon]